MTEPDATPSCPSPRCPGPSSSPRRATRPHPSPTASSPSPAPEGPAGTDSPRCRPGRRKDSPSSLSGPLTGPPQRRSRVAALVAVAALAGGAAGGGIAAAFGGSAPTGTTAVHVAPSTNLAGQQTTNVATIAAASRSCRRLGDLRGRRRRLERVRTAVRRQLPGARDPRGHRNDRDRRPARSSRTTTSSTGPGRSR